MQQEILSLLSQDEQVLLKNNLADCQSLPTYWVDNDTMLYQLIDEIDSLECVALDTEFIRRDTYFPVLALVQVNTGKGIYLVDVPRLDLTEFWQALTEIPMMIWYACGEDLGIFYQLANCPPLTNVVDVQLGLAYLVGDLQLGYSRAVFDVLGVLLDKAESQSNWLARPLSAEQERYAVDDVRYLPVLWQAIQFMLNAKNLYDFVLEDSQSYAKDLHEISCTPDDKVYLNFIAPSYTHEQITVLQAICEWRESLAMIKNIPPSFVIGKQALREIILMLPTSIHELSKTTINRGSLRRYGNEIIKIIKTARALPYENRPPMPNPTYISKDKPFKADLKTLTGEYSQITGVPENVLLKNRWIDELLWASVSGEFPSSYALQGYRKAWLVEKVLPLFCQYKDDITQAMMLAKKAQDKSN